MGGKLLWTGLFLFLVLSKYMADVAFAGFVIMCIGLVLYWLDR